MVWHCCNHGGVAKALPPLLLLQLPGVALNASAALHAAVVCSPGAGCVEMGGATFYGPAAAAGADAAT